MQASGSADKQTGSFAVASGWTIRWETTADSSGIAIYVMDERTNKRLENYSIDDTNGETIVRHGCVCYLDIRNYGETYTVTVYGSPA